MPDAKPLPAHVEQTLSEWESLALLLRAVVDQARQDVDDTDPGLAADARQFLIEWRDPRYDPHP